MLVLFLTFSFKVSRRVPFGASGTWKILLFGGPKWVSSKLVDPHFQHLQHFLRQWHLMRTLLTLLTLLTGKHVLKKHGMSQPNLINFSVLKKCWNKFEVSFTKCWSSKNINHPWTCKQTPSAQSYSHITCTKNVNYVFSLISFTHTRLIWADEGCPIRPIWVDSSLVLTIWLTKIQFVNIHRWNQHDLSPLMSTGHARSRFARH